MMQAAPAFTKTPPEEERAAIPLGGAGAEASSELAPNDAIAGALNVVTAKPVNTFDRWARALYGGQYGTSRSKALWAARSSTIWVFALPQPGTARMLDRQYRRWTAHSE
jgi:hypothetical protein